MSALVVVTLACLTMARKEVVVLRRRVYETASGTGFHSKCTGVVLGFSLMMGARFRGSIKDGGARTSDL